MRISDWSSDVCSSDLLDVFIVNIAIPDMRDTLEASFAELQFVIAAYGLTYAVMLITGGRLGDIFGRRRMFMAGLAGFTLASLACGLAPTAPVLLGARILQGLAAAGQAPSESGRASVRERVCQFGSSSVGAG